MRRSRLLIAESGVIGAVLIAITLGGSVAASTVPLSWSGNLNPEQVARYSDLSALAEYYNATLTDLGTARFSNVSLLIGTFNSVNIPPTVDQTALAADGDVASMNTSIPDAFSFFHETELAIAAKQYVNASTLVDQGCYSEALAGQSLSDFGQQSARLSALSVPTEVYAPGEALTDGEIGGLSAQCNLLRSELPVGSANLTISSDQTSIETGGTVALGASLALNGESVGNQTVLLYLDGDYFGNMTANSQGEAEAQMPIPFVYRPSAVVQAVVPPNATASFGGAQSNALNFTILFDSTHIALGDPPSYLPASSFGVRGNLTTTAGVPLPGAPVVLTFIGDSQLTMTNSSGAFEASFTVPANATDGTHDVYAAFAPKGIFGPSTSFTSVEVVRKPLILQVSAPSLSLSGLSTWVSGRATVGGTPVSDASVTVDTPWGVYTGATGASGEFKLAFQVSAFEFLFGSQVNVTARPPEPYVSSGSASARLGILNPLIVVLPLVFGGLVTFEANQVRAFRKSAKMQEMELAPEEQPDAAEEPPQSALGETPAVQGIPACYERALWLAGRRFGLEFKESQTIREATGEVTRRESSPAAAAFSDLAQIVEDFAYSKGFDSARIETAQRDLTTMEEGWR